MQINLDHLSSVAGIEISEAQRAILAHPEDTRGQLADGYHSFDELYEHRLFLFIALCNVLSVGYPWKSRKHSDGSEWDGWFIAGIGTEEGKQITYHLPNRLWDTLDVEELETAPNFDWHTHLDVLERLANQFFKKQ